MRKKTARACQHCHKAHMTCDESRPCKRCVARGLQETCVDAPRKKKKYLMDVPDELEQQATPNSYDMNISPSIESPAQNTASQLNDLYPPPLSHNSSISNTIIQHPDPTNYPPLQYPAQNQHNNNNNNGNNHRSKFLSSAADLEYSILSDIIKQDYLSPSGMRHSPSQSFTDQTQSPPGPYPQQQQQQQHNTYLDGFRNNSTHSAASTPTPSSLHGHDIYKTYRQGDKSINQYLLGVVQDQLVTFPEVMKWIEEEKISNPEEFIDNEKKKSAISFAIGINNDNNASNDQTYSSTAQSFWGLRYKEAEDIYAKINKPFSYTPGFHALINYLRNRFNKKELVKMAKSMANYRPSFIACTNTLKEEDLIFMEQCFQRTLLEYDKFISISGTPTIVWRRTGQIAYVSEEFCILTGWTKEQLLNKITFIVELMDDVSVVEYFDLFSTIAYGDFRGATMTGCTLLTPENTTMKTTCMWTLKRDVFGIPMMIIGNFLPIL